MEKGGTAPRSLIEPLKVPGIGQSSQCMHGEQSVSGSECSQSTCCPHKSSGIRMWTEIAEKHQLYTTVDQQSIRGGRKNKNKNKNYIQ